MRGFPFGALSSSESLEYSRMMWPCAEREAPYANSLPGAAGCPIEGRGKSFTSPLFHPHQASGSRPTASVFDTSTTEPSRTSKTLSASAAKEWSWVATTRVHSRPATIS